jgi:hypothetical protein
MPPLCCGPNTIPRSNFEFATVSVPTFSASATHTIETALPQNSPRNYYVTAARKTPLNSVFYADSKSVIRFSMRLLVFDKSSLEHKKLI